MPPNDSPHNAQDSDPDLLPQESTESPHTVSGDTVYQFSNDKVFVAGRWDQGAHHRAVEIARDLYTTGLWDARLPIYINDAYKMHNAVYGVRKLPIQELILSNDGSQITVVLPPSDSPPRVRRGVRGEVENRSGVRQEGDGDEAREPSIIGMGKFESPSSGDYLITIWQYHRGGWCYSVTHYRAGLPHRVSIPGGDGWMTNYMDACNAARHAIARHKAAQRRTQE